MRKRERNIADWRLQEHWPTTNLSFRAQSLRRKWRRKHKTPSTPRMCRPLWLTAIHWKWFKPSPRQRNTSRKLFLPLPNSDTFWLRQTWRQGWMIRQWSWAGFDDRREIIRPAADMECTRNQWRIQSYTQSNWSAAEIWKKVNRIEKWSARTALERTRIYSLHHFDWGRRRFPSMPAMRTWWWPRQVEVACGRPCRPRTMTQCCWPIAQRRRLLWPSARRLCSLPEERIQSDWFSVEIWS